jgi:chaperonin GroEL
MSNKLVHRYSDINQKIVDAVDLLTDPIRFTLSPKGSNVIYEDDKGLPNVTNDGATIARNINVKDRVQSAIIDIIKHASLHTNSSAGDGTSSTVLTASILIKEGLKLIESGDWNPMALKREYDNFAVQMTEQLKKLSKPVKTDKDMYFVAKVSASGDEEIANIVVKTVKTAGEHGMVFIEPANSLDTEIIEDTGFNISQGMFAPELRNNPKGFSATYLDVPVLITDKRLYYSQEAESILSVALKNGYKEVVIVAKDFIGEAVPYFVTNHVKGSIRVLLVKEPNVDRNAGATLEDLATYLGGHVVSEKHGSIVDNLKIDDFVIAKKAFSDGQKTLISRDIKEKNKALDDRVAALKKQVKKFGTAESDEAKGLKSRLASLTNGIVTIKVGGSTPLEVNEKIFRYEDAVNATRAAVKDGFLVGGGVSMLRAFRECKFKGELAKLFRKVGEANIRQIAENCGLHGDMVLDTITQLQGGNPNAGFNALTLQYDDLLEAGVIDPYKVSEMVIRNAVSVAGVIIGSRFIIVHDIEEKENGKS